MAKILITNDLTDKVSFDLIHVLHTYIHNTMNTYYDVHVQHCSSYMYSRGMNYAKYLSEQL